jgi:hypothetical protein
MLSAGPIKSIWNVVNKDSFALTSKQNEVLENESIVSEKSDSIEISNTSKVFNKIDNFLNLGKPDRLDISDLNPEEKKEFMKILSSLMKEGVVGYEVLEVNGKPEKHYIVNEIGDKRLYKAKLYKGHGYLEPGNKS